MQEGFEFVNTWLHAPGLPPFTPDFSLSATLTNPVDEEYNKWATGIIPTENHFSEWITYQVHTYTYEHEIPMYVCAVLMYILVFVFLILQKAHFIDRIINEHNVRFSVETLDKIDELYHVSESNNAEVQVWTRVLLSTSYLFCACIHQFDLCPQMQVVLLSISIVPIDPYYMLPTYLLTSYLLTYLRTYLLTYLLTYIYNYLRTYISTYLRIYIHLSEYMHI